RRRRQARRWTRVDPHRRRPAPWDDLRAVRRAGRRTHEVDPVGGGGCDAACGGDCSRGAAVGAVPVA
ncbi:MAG: hypothetical protein AAF387_15320, partial [Pseudomonadota bacterium]